MTKEPLFIISKEVLYNKCYLHGYNRKVLETMDPVVQSRPYNEQEIIPNLHSCLHKEIRNGIEFCHYHNKEIHATLTEHDEKIRQAAINGVLDRAVKAIERQERTAENEEKRSGLTLAIHCIDAIRESVESDAELRQQSGEQQRGQRD